MNLTKTIDLVETLGAVERLLPAYARTGLFSPGAQKYVRETQGRLDSSYRPSAVVLGRREETADAVTLKLLPAEGYPNFTPGQHIDTAVVIRGIRHVRQYSLTGSCEGGTLEITIKRQQGGLVSNYLLDQAVVGMRLEISLPRGNFQVRNQPTSAYCFFSAGSGITPVYAMARAVLASRTKADVYFFHAARSKDAVIFRAELERLAFEFENFKPYFFLSDAGGPRLAYETAVSILPCDMNQHATQVFICGPGAFVQNLEGGFSAAGYKEIQSEFFSLPPVADTNLATGTVRFLRARVTATVETNLLAGAEAAGLKPKHGCRRGICHECKAHKRSGSVRNMLNGKITSGREDIQLCISQPMGDVEIDL